jgi:hypothetical protein
MSDKGKPIVKGAEFQWNGAVNCKVNRVASNGTWIDLTCTRGGSSWGKRQALPLPDSFVRIS